jgi:UDP-2-acetamido-2,6-beta-L-arabino-hexul-4-ose reductase
VTRFAVTGAGGFLGWHLRSALQESGTTVSAVLVGDAFDLATATAAVDGSDRAVHIAGVNRASDEEVTAGNIGFAEQLASALRAAKTPPPVVVYANSTQSTNGSVYGEAKARAAEILAGAASDVGAEFIDVQLPNLFGEHGRPFYNAVTATFSHLIAAGESPVVENDKELTLLHAQNAVDLLTGAVPLQRLGELERNETVSGLLARLQGYAGLYGRGEIPSVADDFDRDLFNTYHGPGAGADRSHQARGCARFVLRDHPVARGSRPVVVLDHGARRDPRRSLPSPQDRALHGAAGPRPHLAAPPVL